MSDEVLTRLYRAVTDKELGDLSANEGKFRESEHKSGEKGFFFELSAAIAFGQAVSAAFGERHTVIETEGPQAAFDGSRPHAAAGEGRGVYLLTSNPHLLARANIVGRQE